MSLRLIDTSDDYLKSFNPDIAVDIYCGLKILAATLVSQFRSSTYQWICLRRTGIMS
jgi:hypothetical protein